MLEIKLSYLILSLSYLNNAIKLQSIQRCPTDSITSVIRMHTCHTNIYYIHNEATVNCRKSLYGK